MRKLLIALLVCALALSGLAFAEDEDISIDEYSGLLTSFSAEGDVVVPDEVNGIPVLGLGYGVFYSNDAITSVELPETMQGMGGANFYFCDSLTSLTLPDSLEAISEFCVFCCYELTEVIIPARVAYIGMDSFYSCYELRDVTFLGEVPVMGAECFTELADDVVFHVPDNQLDAYAAALPEGSRIEPLGMNAMTVDRPEREDDFAFDADTGTITGYSGVDAHVVIPESIDGVPVTSIGESAFAYNQNIIVVTVPEGVTEIAAEAFAGSDMLAWVDLPSTLKTIGAEAFQGYHGDAVRLPEGLETIGDNAFRYASLAGELVLPEGVTSVGEGAFQWTNVTDVYFPSTIETIAPHAFEKANVDYLCFAGCVMPEMSADSFGSCEIADVDISTHATKQQMLDAQALFDSLGQNARVWRMQNPDVSYTTDNLSTYEGGFMTGYTGEMTHIRPYDAFDNVTTVGLADGALMGNQVVTYFAVCYNDAFTTIGANAFAGSVVEKVDLFDSVTTIGPGAFRNTRSLTELVLPESVTEIGEGAFDGSGLVRVTVLCDAAVLPEGAFSHCANLREITFTHGAVPANVAAGCPLESVTLGDGVTTVGEGAFTAAPAVETTPEPTPEPTAEPTAEPTPEPTVEPTPEPTPESAARSVTEVKYVCTSYEVSGYTLNASTLGAEYSVIFHDDGSAEFTLAGKPVPGLSWTKDGNTLEIVFLDGTPLRFDPAETGFQLNFYDSMLMLFEPVEP